MPSYSTDITTRMKMRAGYIEVDLIVDMMLKYAFSLDYDNMYGHISL